MVHDAPYARFLFDWVSPLVLQEQVRVMTDKWHVYMTFDGRISMAGLSSSKCHYLAEAIADAMRSA